MIPGSTPTHIFTIPFDTGLLKGIKIIYSQNDEILVTKTMDDCKFDAKTVTTTLTQDETLKFKSDVAGEVQIKLLTKDDKCIPSVVKRFGIAKHLENEVFDL